MEPSKSPRFVFFAVGWLAALALSLVAVLSEGMPILPAYAPPHDLLLYFTEVELFLLLVVWPLFLREPKSFGVEVGHLLALLALGLPLAVFCRETSGNPWIELSRGQILLAVYGGCVSVFFKFRLGHSWYYLGLFAVSAGFPFVYYLILEFTGRSIALLPKFSPYYAVGALELPALLPSVLLAFGVALGVLVRRQR